LQACSAIRATSGSAAAGAQSAADRVPAQAHADLDGDFREPVEFDRIDRSGEIALIAVMAGLVWGAFYLDPARHGAIANGANTPHGPSCRAAPVDGKLFGLFQQGTTARKQQPD